MKIVIAYLASPYQAKQNMLFSKEYINFIFFDSFGQLNRRTQNVLMENILVYYVDAGLTSYSSDEWKALNTFIARVTYVEKSLIQVQSHTTRILKVHDPVSKSSSACNS
jgi:hypothetical protein